MDQNGVQWREGSGWQVTMDSEEQDRICMMVKMEGEAYSWAVVEVEPRDLVTRWIWEMLQKKGVGLLLGF